MTKRQAPPGTQAIQRAIRLLKIFTGQRPELTLHELSSMAGLTKTTTHRLLAVLEAESLIVRGSAQNTYRLGPAVIALGVQALRTSDLRAAVRPYLEVLAERTGETVTLEVLSEGQMLILDEVPGRHLVSASGEIFTRWPVHATSTGKALLAALPDDQCRELLESPLTKYTFATFIDRRKLHEELSKIREAGYATAIEELEVGFCTVGAALRSPMGDVAGAISVGGPASRIEPKRIGALGAEVKATAERISEQLGYPAKDRL
jgi:DNA-binding IclR family transcriptional regulator